MTNLNFPLLQMAEAGLDAIEATRRLEKLIPQETAIPKKVAQVGYNSGLGFALYSGRGTRYGRNVNNTPGSYAQGAVVTTSNVGVS